ncbi:MAG TPA: D-2-hydroxyacid dehydrogenase family protein [Solirubrobacteraceae bacterium]|nr:D-2-hydroxyacid dehydrogenase family protein [Solirubrobacteraceae bacterium]
MHRLAILDDYQYVAGSLADWSRLEPAVDVRIFHDHLADPDAVAERLHDFEIIIAMRERTPFPAALFERLPKLELLVSTGARNRAIDLEAARNAGVVVCGTRALGSGTVELTWGLIIALTRNIAREDAAVRGGEWQVSIGPELAGRTIGIVGLGRVGGRVAEIAAAFGMSPIAWSENLTAERAAAVGARLVSKDELFETADIVTLHLVLGERTRGLVGARELALMKPTAYLVNTARGPIVDERALVAVLDAGSIAGAALDVFDEEPLPLGHPLRALPNTVITPHIGYVARDAYEAFYGDALEDVEAFLAGSPIRLLEQG